MPQAKFLTDQGQPLHPVVKHETDPDGKEYVKALLNQGVFTPGNVPPLTIERDGEMVENEVRYHQMRLTPETYAALPEGSYDIDEAGNISNITAPAVGG